MARSATLLSGSPGIGKSTLATQFVLGGPRRERGLFVSLEEGPAQVLASAASFGLPMRRAVQTHRVELVYLPPERIRSEQFLAIVATKVAALGARRVVLDGINQLADTAHAEDLRNLLHGIVMRLRAQGATALLTFEVKALERTDAVVELGLSPIADNLIMLRYRPSAAGLSPTLTVVKTRASALDRGTHVFHLGPGGVHLEVPSRRRPRP